MFYLKYYVEKSAQIVNYYQSIKTEIGGGMHPKAAALLGFLLSIQEANHIAGDLLEIGVFKGWGSYLPACYCRDTEKVVLVDIAQHHLDWSKAFLIEQKATTIKQIETLLIDSAAGMGLSEGFTSNKRFRWIHIDGEHSYAAVISDLDSAAKYSTSETIICVDDVDHTLAPSINDAMQDWLRRNNSWRLLIRGFNKAYIVSIRSRIRWFDYISFLPDIFERYFSSGILLASQTHSADTNYFSYGEPFDKKKYLKVNQTVSGVDEFDGFNPRTLLLGSTRRPNILIFGNCQMRVLHGALVHAAALCGLDLNFEYVRDVHELEVEDAERIRTIAKSSAGMICQNVTGDKFLLRTDDIISSVSSAWKIIVPSMHFNAYWPNHADLQMTASSPHCMPTDAIIYSLVQNNYSDSEIIDIFNSPIYTKDQINDWFSNAIDRLREREVKNNTNVRLSEFLSQNARQNRLFFMFNHPGKQVFDHVLRCVLKETSKVFEPRNKDIYDGIQSGVINVPYDMSMIDFVDIPPLKAVSLALNWPSENHAYRYLRPRGTYGIHNSISLADEIKFVRMRFESLNQEQRIFNLSQIQNTSLATSHSKYTA